MVGERGGGGGVVGLISSEKTNERGRRLGRGCCGGGDRLSVSLCFLEWATSQEVKRLSNDSGSDHTHTHTRADPGKATLFL